MNLGNPVGIRLFSKSDWETVSSKQYQHNWYWKYGKGQNGFKVILQRNCSAWFIVQMSTTIWPYHGDTNFFLKKTRNLYSNLMSRKIFRYAWRLRRLVLFSQGHVGAGVAASFANRWRQCSTSWQVRVVPTRSPQELNRHGRKKKTGSAKLDRARAHTACHHVPV